MADPQAKAAAAVDQAVEEGEQRSNDLVLSNGIRFTIRPVSSLVARRVIQNIEVPKVPVVYIEDKDREEENPNDPDYLAAMEEYQGVAGLAAMQLFMTLGLKLESVPEGIDRPEDSGWFEALEAAGVEMDAETDAKRFRWWCESVAFTDADDFNRLGMHAARAMGLAEEDVEQALSDFRGNGERGADTAVQAPQINRAARRVSQRTTGRSTRGRGA